MWMIIGILQLAMLIVFILVMRRRRRVRFLARPLVEELQRGLPQYLVEAASDRPVIHIKHAFISWTVEVRRQLGGGMCLQLSPQPEWDRHGQAIERGPQMRCRVRTRSQARHVGRRMASVVVASKANTTPIMRFVPRPEYA